MAYTIRYGPRGQDFPRPWQMWKIQLWGSGVVLAGVLLLSVWEQPRELLRAVLTVGETSVLEEALGVFYLEGAEGKWWVDGLAQLCRTVLEGA